MGDSKTVRADLVVRKAWNLVRRHGVRGAGVRAVRAGYIRLGASALDFPLLPGDIASSDRLPVVTPTGGDMGSGPMSIGWVTVPPGPGSGGHTTMFRMITALEQAGHSCVLYLYDRHGGDVRQREAVVREYWPGVRAEVRDVRDGVAGMDALVATSWQTAHIVARYASAVRRSFYFVQDYEPYFYARGSEYALAEDTFRFGFYGITAGRWLGDLLGKDFGMECQAFEFGADTDVYRYDGGNLRDGVVFYAKPTVARRGYRLGVEVLHEFSRRHPNAPLHLFGDRTECLPFAVESHGRLTPDSLNQLYNRCRVGLTLSFTNISLIPWELLASGTVPVINDADHNRIVLDNASVRWAAPTVGSLVDQLSEAYEGYTDDIGQRCAASVQAMSWDAAGAVVVEAIERELGARQLR